MCRRLRDVQAQVGSHQIQRSPACRLREASFKAAQSDLISQQANLERARLDFDRGQGLYKDGLIPKTGISISTGKQPMMRQRAGVESVRLARAISKKRNWIRRDHR